MTSESPWLLCRRPNPGAAARLYCIPHAGGTAGEFLFWSDALRHCEVRGVQPPGRGSRMDDQPFTKMSDLVQAMAQEIQLIPPYALFGHSLGAAIAYELVLALRERGRPLPARLYLSAQAAPHLHQPEPSAPLLDDTALLAEAEQQFGPAPAELRDDPDWPALMLDGLRADMCVLASYQPLPTEPLTCSIVVMGGTDDPTTTREDLAAWNPYTTGTFEVRTFTGDHFYFREHHHEICRDFAADLCP